MSRSSNVWLRGFPADWDGLGKGAGHIRNKQMAEYATDLLLIWDGKSRGSKNMLEEAKSHDLNIMQYFTEPIITSGDLFDRFDNEDEGWTLVHGCNCMSVMGKGIAKIIRDKYPIVYETDSGCNLSPMQKLGYLSEVRMGKRTVINAYTQYKPGRNASYEAVIDDLKTNGMGGLNINILKSDIFSDEEYLSENSEYKLKKYKENYRCFIIDVEEPDYDKNNDYLFFDLGDVFADIKQAISHGLRDHNVVIKSNELTLEWEVYDEDWYKNER